MKQDDLQKAAKAFVERWVPADSRTGAAYRDAEFDRLREALNYATDVYTGDCALGEDRIGLSEFYSKIEAILAKGEK